MRHFLLLSSLLAVALSPIDAVAQAEGEDDEVIAGDDDEVVAGDDDEVVAADDDEVVAGDDDEVVAGDDDEVVAESSEAESDPKEVAASGSAAGAASGALPAEGTFEPGEEPYRAPKAGLSVIWGRVVDAKSGEPALEASVKALGTKYETFTDFDGYYRLEVPPGTYRLEIFYELYDTQTIDGVTATANAVGRTDVQMAPQAGAIDEVIIEDEAETQTVEGLALARQRSISAGDAIGREQISKGTDQNAAQAASRVVGANIVGGRFVYVRGLGERYSNSLLSGYPLPSPEPDRAAVPLDVFPSAVLDSITIVKTFSPDMPADFAGGSVQIETRSVPKTPLFKANIWGGLNTQATGQDRLGYAGGSTDWFGFDDGTRALPSSVPADRPLPSPDAGQARSDMNTSMSPGYTSTPPDHGMSVVGGNTFRLGKGQEIGVIASYNYSRRFFKIDNAVLKEFEASDEDPRGYRERLNFTVDEGTSQVRWGAFGKVSYVPGKGHKISLSGLHSQLADDSARTFVGYNSTNPLLREASQLDWVERGMSFGLLSGEHEFPALNKAELQWDVSLSRAYRSQPDRRDVAFYLNPRLDDGNGDWSLVRSSESGRHFWLSQTEDSRGGKIDWKQPLVGGDHTLDLKVGGLINRKERAFSARRFLYQPTDATAAGSAKYNCGSADYLMDCPDRVFGGDSIENFRLNEGTQTGDLYTANLDVYAGYGLLDLDIAKRLRLAGGARVEVTDQGVVPRDVTDGSVVNDKVASLNSVDALPAISAIFSATKKIKTRASYAQTLARPQVRELAPFAFADYLGGRVTTGNPNLILSRIDNLDLRFEFWPTLAEVLAFSTFYKHIANPIETIIEPSSDIPQVTYKNSKGANIVGIELEARKNLGFLTKVLNDFALNANVTFAYSRTEVEQSGVNTITNPSRPLMNQSPWVLNLALDYENQVGTNVRLSYNVNGPALVLVGTEGLDDGYLQPFHRVDLAVGQKFMKHWIANLLVQNLINDDFLTTVGKVARDDNIMRQFTLGTQIQLQLGYEL